VLALDVFIPLRDAPGPGQSPEIFFVGFGQDSF